jgi:hypothetical protein
MWMLKPLFVIALELMGITKKKFNQIVGLTNFAQGTQHNILVI